MKTAEEARREIFKGYEEDPSGWHVFTSRDARGYFDLTVVHHEEVWFLKEELINPYESVGFAIKEKVERKPENLPVSFGFRPLPPDLLAKVGERFDERLFTQALYSALKEKPLSLSQIRSPIAIQGPIVRALETGSIVPSRRGEFDTKLGLELGKLIDRRFGYLKTTYG